MPLHVFIPLCIFAGLSTCFGLCYCCICINDMCCKKRDPQEFTEVPKENNESAEIPENPQPGENCENSTKLEEGVTIEMENKHEILDSGFGFENRPNVRCLTPSPSRLNNAQLAQDGD